MQRSHSSTLLMRSFGAPPLRASPGVGSTDHIGGGSPLRSSPRLAAQRSGSPMSSASEDELLVLPSAKRRRTVEQSPLRRSWSASSMKSPGSGLARQRSGTIEPPPLAPLPPPMLASPSPTRRLPTRSPPPAPRLPSSRRFARPPPIRTMKSLEGWESPAAVALPSAAAPAVSASPSPRRSRRLGAAEGELTLVPHLASEQPYLYISDELGAADVARLREAGITAVLNCTSQPSAAATAGPEAMRYMQLDLLDNTADLPRMQGCIAAGVEFIHGARLAGGATLVHCHRGISRSCTLAIAYLVWATRRSADDCFSAVRAARRQCDPNFGYWCALLEWERQVLPPQQRPSSRPASRDGRPASAGVSAPVSDVERPRPPSSARHARSRTGGRSPATAGGARERWWRLAAGVAGAAAE